MAPIQVWRFHDAPFELQFYSPHGGDEDWLALIPATWTGLEPTWMDEGSAFGCCNVSYHIRDDLTIVVIGAHA